MINRIGMMREILNKDLDVPLETLAFATDEDNLIAHLDLNQDTVNDFVSILEDRFDITVLHNSYDIKRMSLTSLNAIVDSKIFAKKHHPSGMHFTRA